MSDPYGRVKKDVAPDAPEILQRVSYLQLDDPKKAHLSVIIQKRIQENLSKIQEYTITL